MNRLPAERTGASFDLSAVPVRNYHEAVADNTLSAAWRRRGIIIAAIVIAVLVAGGALAVLKKTYTAQAGIQLDLGKREVTLANEQAPTVTLDAASIIQGEAKIIRSRMMARRVVQRLGVGVDAPDNRWEAVTGKLADWLNQAQKYLHLADDKPKPAATENETEKAISTILSRLSVVTDNRSYLIEIAYTSDDPVKSAIVANTFAKEYLRRRGELNLELASNVTEWLGSQIQQATAALRKVEEEIAAFRQRTLLVDVGANGETIQQQQLHDLNAQLSAATLARITEENRLVRVRQIMASGATPSAADLQGSPLVQALVDREAIARRELTDAVAKFGPRHPDVAAAQTAVAALQAALRTQLVNARSVIEANVAAAARTEANLKTRLEKLQTSLVTGKVEEAELRDLQAKALTIRERLAALTRNYDQTLAAKNLQLVAGSLTMPAEPTPTPSSPKPMIVLSIGAIAGAVFGLMIALLAERKDRGFRTTAEVEALTDIPCLAMLPEMAKGSVRAGRGGVDNVIFDEAVRALGTGIGLFGDTGKCRVVLVTSSLPKEGKSTVCQSLARLLVGVGHRVLLVDGTRGLDEGAPSGVADGGTLASGSLVLLTSTTAGEPVRVVHQGSALMVDVYSPDKFDRLIEDARKHFDIVLVDGTPAMLLADSFVLGRKADAVVHVVHWGKTLKSTVLSSLHRLREQSVVVNATVLARVDARRHRKLNLKDESYHYRKQREFFEAVSRARPRTAEPRPPNTDSSSSHAA